uniref:Uncharacterized protein n=1 Tax=Heterorhabditis bacteriophora TaxID=37862 RepID=A0A1I7WNM1_HETBA
MSQQFRDVVRQMFTGKFLPHMIRDKDNSTTMALVQITAERDSDDKRQSICLFSANGTLSSSTSACTVKITKNSEKALKENKLFFPH